MTTLQGPLYTEKIEPIAQSICWRKNWKTVSSVMSPTSLLNAVISRRYWSLCDVADVTRNHTMGQIVKGIVGIDRI